jgi:hypothetical protein
MKAIDDVIIRVNMTDDVVDVEQMILEGVVMTTNEKF